MDCGQLSQRSEGSGTNHVIKSAKIKMTQQIRHFDWPQGKGIEESQTHGFLVLLDTGLDSGMSRIIFDGLDLFLAENLDILFGIELLWAGMAASGPRHEVSAVQ